MSRYFTEKITEIQLRDKLWKLVQNSEDYRNGYTNTNTLDEWFNGYATSGGVSCLSKRIEKDLSKVDFNMENVLYSKEDNYIQKDRVGFRTLSNGLIILGIVTGGDWEIPIYVIFYWSGKEIRVYIPKEGNPYNRKEKSAFGNHDSDEAEALKIGATQVEINDMDIDLNMSKINADIQKRIIFKK